MSQANPYHHQIYTEIIGNFSNGDGNENAKKAIGLGPVYMEVEDLG